MHTRAQVLQVLDVVCDRFEVNNANRPEWNGTATATETETETLRARYCDNDSVTIVELTFYFTFDYYFLSHTFCVCTVSISLRYKKKIVHTKLLFSFIGYKYVQTLYSWHAAFVCPPRVWANMNACGWVFKVLWMCECVNVCLCQKRKGTDDTQETKWR